MTNPELLEAIIRWTLVNFNLAMYLLAVVFIVIHQRIVKNISYSEIVYRWFALFVLGFTSIYTFIMHAYYPELSAAAIGWKTSPFQFEVAVADLGIGLLGVLSFRASFGFRVATVVMASTFLWGAAIGHISQMILFGNFSPGNAGTWFWSDLATPLILIIAILRMNQGK